MKKHRFFTAVAAVIYMIMACSVFISAQEYAEAEVSVSDLVFSGSGEARMVVTLDKVPENGLCFLKLKIAYDDTYVRLTDVGVTELAGNPTQSASLEVNPYVVMWDSLNANYKTGVLMTLTFVPVSSDMEQTAVSVTCDECLETIGRDILDAECRIGSHDVYYVVPEDLNGDGNVDNEDCLYLLRHSLRPDVYPVYNIEVDYSGDGIVTGKDSELLYMALL